MAPSPQLLSWTIPAAQPGPAPPMLVLLHGVGGSEAGMLAAARELDPRFVRVAVRGPLDFGPGAYGFFHVDFTPAGPVHNATEAEASRRALADWLPAAAREQGADPKRVYVLGFSQGAIMAMSLLLTRPDLVAGAVAWSGRILAEASPGPEASAALGQRDALVIHGQYDRTLPVHHGQASRRRLEQLALRSVGYHELPMGHEVDPQVLALTNAWLAHQFDGRADQPD